MFLEHPPTPKSVWEPQGPQGPGFPVPPHCGWLQADLVSLRCREPAAARTQECAAVALAQCPLQPRLLQLRGCGQHWPGHRPAGPAAARGGPQAPGRRWAGVPGPGSCRLLNIGSFALNLETCEHVRAADAGPTPSGVPRGQPAALPERRLCDPAFLHSCSSCLRERPRTARSTRPRTEPCCPAGARPSAWRGCGSRRRRAPGPGSSPAART